MGSFKKFRFQVGGITLSANDKTIAQVMLAHALKEAGVIEIDQSGTNPNQPTLGQLWEGQGGIYTGVILGDDDQAYHLILADKEFNGEWGNRGTEIEGADSRNDGQANTKAMVEAGLELAKEVSAFEADGHSDFYLPSQCELNLCFANTRKHFEKEYYWSSTQFSANLGWVQHFYHGNQCLNVKLEQLRARAVRRFLCNSEI